MKVICNTYRPKHITSTFLITLCFILCTSASLWAQKSRDKADKLFDKNLFEEAIPFYKLATKEGKSKERESAKVKLADCYRIMGDYETAEKMYKKILSRKRKDPQNYLNYAQSLKSAAKYAEASEQFKKYIALKPEDKMGLVNLLSCDSAEVWLEETIGKEVQNINRINSEDSEFSPLITPEGELIFCSSRSGGSSSFISFNGGEEVQRLDLYSIGIVELDQENKKAIQNMKKLNSPAHEGSATLSSDGTEMYFTRTVSGKKDKINNKVLKTLHVYYSKKDTLGVWSDPVSAFDFNSFEYSVAHPSLSYDGQTIFYMSDKKGGYGETDIYYSNRVDDTKWSAPINLGGDVNTFGHELFPFISEKNVLYFSSEAHPGMGQLDVFYCEKVEDKWTNVRNMKPPYNSIANDFGIVLDGKDMRGFISSDRFNGFGAEDIYSFSEDIPLQLSIAGNTISISDKSIFDNIKYKLVNMNEESSEESEYSGYSDGIEPVNGKYEIELNNTEKYQLVAKKYGFAFNKVDIVIEQDSISNEYKASIFSESQPVEIIGGLESLADDSTHSHETAAHTWLSLSNDSRILEKAISNEKGDFQFKYTLDPSESYSVNSEYKVATAAEILEYSNEKNQVIEEAVAESGTVECRGKVMYRGLPLKGATVQLLEEGLPSQKAITNSVGKFTFMITANLDHTLVASKGSEIEKSFVHFSTSTKDERKGLFKVLTLKSTDGIPYTGTIKDVNADIRNALITLRNQNQVIAQTTCDKEGKFDFELLPSEDYEVTITGEGYEQLNVKMTTVGINPGETLEEDVELDTLSMRSVLIWTDMEFVKREALIKASSLSNLDKLVEFLMVNSTINVELSTHTTIKGDPAENELLSFKRAEYIKTYLILEDIDSERATPKGYGGTMPIIPDEQTEEDALTNRRVEMRLREL